MDNLLRSVQVIQKMSYAALLVVLLLEVQGTGRVDLAGAYELRVAILYLRDLLHQSSHTGIQVVVLSLKVLDLVGCGGILSAGVVHGGGCVILVAVLQPFLVGG